MGTRHEEHAGAFACACDVVGSTDFANKLFDDVLLRQIADDGKPDSAMVHEAIYETLTSRQGKTGGVRRGGRFTASVLKMNRRTLVKALQTNLGYVVFTWWLGRNQEHREKAAALLAKQGTKDGNGIIRVPAGARDTMAAELAQGTGLSVDMATVMLTMVRVADAAQVQPARDGGTTATAALNQALLVASADAASQPAALQSAVLRELITRLQALADDAADWSELDAFIDACRELDEGRRDRIGSLRTQLKVAIQELRESCADALRVLADELHGHESWDAERPSQDRVPELLEPLGRLTNLLREFETCFASLRNATTDAELEALMKRRNQLKAAIRPLYAELHAVLGGIGAPPPGGGAISDPVVDKPSAPSTNALVPSEKAAEATSLREEAPGPGPAAERAGAEAGRREEADTGVPVVAAPQAARGQPHSSAGEAVRPAPQVGSELVASCAVAEPEPAREIVTAAEALLSGPKTAETRATISMVPHSAPSADDEEAEAPPDHPPAAVMAPVPAVAPRETVRRAFDSRRAAAEAVLSGDESAVPALLWLSIRDGDVAGAYWLGRGLESRESSVVPSWLLAALAGSELIDGDASPLVPGLLEVSYAHDFPDASVPTWQALAFAAAVQSLGAPGTGLPQNWMAAPASMPFLKQPVAELQEFANISAPIPPNFQAMVASEANRRDRITKACEAVRRWRADAGRKRTMFPPANTAWAVLLREGRLPELLDAAADDRRDSLAKVREGLEEWREPTHAERAIQVAVKKAGGKEIPIIGAAGGWLRALIDEALSLVAAWAELVQFEQEGRGAAAGTRKHLERLRERLALSLPNAFRGLEGFASNHLGIDEHAVAAVVRRALRILSENLALPRPATPELGVPEDVAIRQRLLRRDKPLKRTLARRLLTLTGLRLPASDDSWDEALRNAAQSLALDVKNGPTTRAAIEEWCARKDFRFVGELVATVEPAEERAQLEDHVQALLARERRVLRERARRLEKDIEQTVVDGVIGVERSELQQALQGDIEQLEDLAGYEARLLATEARLRELRRQASEGQRARWRAVVTQLEGTSWSDEHKGLARRRVEALFEAGDYRSADELVEWLRKAVEQRLEYSPSLFMTAEPFDSALERFWGVLGELEAKIPANDRNRDLARRVVEVHQAAGFPVRGKRDAEALHEYWQVIAQKHGAMNNEAMRTALASLFDALGFDLASTVSAAVTVEDARRFRVKAVAPDCPVPAYGSRAAGEHRVLAVFPRDVTDDLRALQDAVKGVADPAIILFFGRLSRQRRLQWARHCQSTGAVAVVMDEWLLLHLGAWPRESRQKVFFETTLPFTGMNPYPQVSGPVPPEMFFGRNDIARALRSFDDGCIVFGGRQLGKSALLDIVRGQFDAESPDNTALMLNIRSVGDPLSDQRSPRLWELLRDGLKTAKFLKAQVTTSQPTEVQARIFDALRDAPSKRLLLLFDEADNFLDEDARRGFESVTLLGDLMMRHRDRCKVIFAGLHNVQRFQGVPNQPLSHFGRAQLVGPLEAADAINLIRRPLEALGFRFERSEGNAAIIRILSYTNYHPGLIQLFCHNLLKRLHKKVASNPGMPWSIRESDVEEVYRAEETRRVIAERFDMTLALDHRYQAIVWSMIVDATEHGGAQHSLSAHKALEMLRTYWKAGFEDVDSVAMQALLEEMEGLGVLVRTANGEFRLRSPNVARLLGSPESIEQRLLELGERPAAKIELDEYRCQFVLGGRKSAFSPLTFAQERILNQAIGRVTLISGCEASGLGEVGEALRRTFGGPEQKQHFDPIDVGVGGASAWSDTVRAVLAKRVGRDSSMVFTRLAEVGVTTEFVAAAVKLVEDHGSRRGSLRVVLALEPGAAWELATSAQTVAAPGPQIIDLKRWTQTALVRMLHALESDGGDERLRQRMLAEVTGGWHCRVADLAVALSKSGDERAATDSVARGMDDREARVEFLRRLQLSGLPRAVEVLELIAEQPEGVGPDTEFEGVLDGDVAALAGKSRDLLEFLWRLGCLERRDDRFFVERVTAAALRR